VKDKLLWPLRRKWKEQESTTKEKSVRDVCVKRRNTSIKKKKGEASESENSVIEISVRNEKGMKSTNVHSIQVDG
jgi:hypothetical protein